MKINMQQFNEFHEFNEFSESNKCVYAAAYAEFVLKIS